MLTVDPPTLTFEPTAGGHAALEKPLDVRVAPVLLEGQSLGADALSTFGFFVYRRATSSAAPEIWNDAAKAWQLEGSSPLQPAPTPTPFAHEADQPKPWHGIVVAAGGKDANGQPQFSSAVGGHPLYSVRALFTTKDSTELTLSGPSDNVMFASVSDSNLMVLGPGDGEQPDSATQARIMLKSPAMSVIGRVLIERDSPGARVTLDNASGASIVLHPNGHIELRPAAGQQVIIAGDLDVGHITYLPAGGGVKQVLP